MKLPCRLGSGALLFIASVSIGCRSTAVDVASYAPPATVGTRQLPAPTMPPAMSPGSDATLDDLRVHAARYNPGLAALRHRFRAAQERAPQASALPDPVFTYTEYLREVETRTGPQERSYALKQAFPWFGKRGLRGAMADEGARVAWFDLLAAQLQLDRQLRRVWADYYYLGKAIEVTRETIDLLSRLEAVARDRLAAGIQKYPGVIRLQVEVGRLEDRLRSFQDRVVPMRATLNALLDRPTDAAIEIPRVLDIVAVAVVKEDLAAFLAAHSPELQGLRHAVERSQLARDLAAKESYPDWALGVKTIETGASRLGSRSGSGEDPWMVSLSMELPLWFSKYRAGEREAEEQWRAARRRRSNRAQQLLASVARALFEQKDASDRIALYSGALIPKAEESLAAIEGSFRAGESDFLDLIDGSRVLLEFWLAEERGRADLLRAVADLDSLLGRYALAPREDER